MLATIKAWLGWGELQPMLARSSHWPAVRAEHLQIEPCCRACGTKDHLQVHHRLPVHLSPELELEPANLVTLCESPSHSCHFAIGHLLSWRAYNPSVLFDADVYFAKVQTRPEK